MTVLAGCIALLLLFDWNHAKPWINTRVSTALDRTVTIRGDLALTWDAPHAETGWRGWLPWPRLRARDVIIGSPTSLPTSGSATPHLAEVAEITFSLRPLALLDRKIVIPSLALDAPRIHLLRLRDGRNNWTFPQSEQKAWRLELHRLLLTDGTVALDDAVTRARLQLQVATLDDSAQRLGWRLSGSYRGEPVSGSGRAGTVLALRERDAMYPLDADIRVGKTTISAHGTLTDPGQLAAVDLQLKLAGASMAQLFPLTGIVLPETGAFATAGRLHGAPSRGGAHAHWTYENFTGKVGASDLAGTLRYEARVSRPLLQGELVSKQLHFADLAPLIGADSTASRTQRGVATPQPVDKVLPVERFKTGRWTAIDADVRFSGERIVRSKELPIDHLSTHLTLTGGVLALAPLKFGIAGGNLAAQIRLDSRREPLAAEMTLSARQIRLKQLFPTLQSMRASVGELHGDATLKGSGNSVAALLGSADGELQLAVRDGTVSKFLLEAAGLNIGSVVLTQLFGDKQVALHCAVSNFSIRDGVMQARKFVVDTEDATLRITGALRLRQEQLALKVVPETKGVRLISLRTPLYLTGSFKQPKVEINKGVLALRAGSALALGIFAPAASALLPLINVGPPGSNPCTAAASS